MNPRITFVLTACGEENAHLVSIGSLLCQTNPNWKCIVMHGNDADFPYYPANPTISPDKLNEITLHISHSANTIWSFPGIQTPYPFSDNRITQINNEKTGFWGHYDRIKSLSLVDTDYIIQSSIQDFFFPKLVEELYLALSHPEPDMVLWNSMNHLYQENSILFAEPERLKTDWGNMCVRTGLAREVGINHPERDICDGLFAEEVAAKSSIIKKINKVLTIHS